MLLRFFFATVYRMLVGCVRLVHDFVGSPSVCHDIALRDNDKTCFMCCGDGVHVWDVRCRKRICTLHGHSENLTAAAVMRNGRYVW